jgi:hypothetical protein
LLLIVMTVVSLSFLVSGPALADVTKYKVPVISDFTGSWAQLMKSWVPMHKAVFAWWNDTEGKKLGVELELKHYDGRYDSSVIASVVSHKRLELFLFVLRERGNVQPG